MKQKMIIDPTHFEKVISIMHTLGSFPESLFEFLESSFKQWNEESELREEA